MLYNMIIILKKIVPFIIAVLPETIKPMPVDKNKIKQLINGERINIIAPKILSNDKIIDQYTEFLRRKSYNVTVLISHNGKYINDVTLNNLSYLS